jgi:hypothetical protein
VVGDESADAADACLDEGGRAILLIDSHGEC